MKNQEMPARLAQDLPQDPSVAVLLGVRNAAMTVGAVVDAMKRQTYAGNWKMWIAVAPSDDGTHEAVLAAVAGDCRFVVFDNPRGDLASGFNLGLQRSKSDVVTILSGHCLPDADYLLECVITLRNTHAGLVGGAARPRGDGYLHEAIAIAHRVGFGLGGGAFRDEDQEGWVDTAYVGSYPRSVLDEIGGWNETLTRNQDIELNARVRKAGYGIYLARSVVVYYRPRASLWALARQNYGNGYWNVRTARQIKGALSWRHWMPGIFVGSVVLGNLGVILARALDLLSIEAFLKVLLLAALSGYCLAAILASFAAGRRFGRRYTGVLLIVFATLHFSYGFGEIVGCLAAGGGGTGAACML